MKVHSDRSILEDLQELYELAVHEHGRGARSAQIILDSMAAERLGHTWAMAQPRPVTALRHRAPRPLTRPM